MDLGACFNNWEADFKKTLHFRYSIQNPQTRVRADEKDVVFSDLERDHINKGFYRFINDYELLYVLGTYNFTVPQCDLLIHKHKVLMFMTDLMFCKKYQDIYDAIINDIVELKRSQKLTCERVAIINAGDVFLERYMQRMMHPARLAPLLADANIDVDTFMEAYIAAL